jgi:(2Fe-2S) ferredoxin
MLLDHYFIFSDIFRSDIFRLGIIVKTSYYKHHVFFCTNKRTDGRPCCQDNRAAEIRDYMKRRIKESGHSGKGQIRVNTAGCLDRCELGPVIVIYPQEIWYTYMDEEDIDEIIESLLSDGEPVERLLISDKIS